MAWKCSILPLARLRSEQLSHDSFCDADVFGAIQRDQHMATQPLERCEPAPVSSATSVVSNVSHTEL
jgi:hypothetical protein